MSENMGVGTPGREASPRGQTVDLGELSSLEEQAYIEMQNALDDMTKANTRFKNARTRWYALLSDKG